MTQYKLSDSDQKQIAHFIAQRSIVTIAPGQPRKATEEYLEVFNDTLAQIRKYNESATDL